MKKPKHYEIWHRRGIDWCRANYAESDALGPSIKDYVDYQNWRAARAERAATLRGWLVVLFSACAATASGLNLWISLSGR